MDFELKNGQVVHIRPFEESDFKAVHELNTREGWNNLVQRKEDAKNAWLHSNVTFVAKTDNQVIGCVRGLTDQYITLFICELLIQEEYRGSGIGTALLQHVHHQYPKTRMELLATSTSHTFYEHHRFRAFYGFRKTIEE